MTPVRLVDVDTGTVVRVEGRRWYLERGEELVGQELVRAYRIARRQGSTAPTEQLTAPAHADGASRTVAEKRREYPGLSGR